MSIDALLLGPGCVRPSDVMNKGLLIDVGEKSVSYMRTHRECQ